MYNEGIKQHIFYCRREQLLWFIHANFKFHGKQFLKLLKYYNISDSFFRMLLQFGRKVWVNKVPPSLSLSESLCLCESRIFFHQPYYSRTSQRDIPSGLFGPLIVCSPMVPNDAVGSTLQQKVFIVGSVDETQSWYLDDNLKTYTGIVDTNDPRFAEANAIRGKCSNINFSQCLNHF